MLSRRVKYSDFAFIMERINNRLDGKAGRVTLAQSVVTSTAMSSDSMQNLWIPQGIFFIYLCLLVPLVFGKPLSKLWRPCNLASRSELDVEISLFGMMSFLFLGSLCSHK